MVQDLFMSTANNDSIKILFVADVPLDNPSSGSENMLNRQAKDLSAAGVEVCAIVRLLRSEKPSIKRLYGIKLAQFYAPTHRFWRFLYQHLKYSVYFCEKFRRYSPFSAIVAHQPINCFILLLKSKQLRSPLLYNFHSPSHEEYLLSRDNPQSFWNYVPMLMRRKIEQYCLQKAQLVMVASEYMKQKVIDIHHIDETRIFVNPGGVDLDCFHLPDDRRLQKKNLELPKDRVHLLTIRNLEPRMGLDNLIKAIALLEERKFHVHLVIGGEGPERQKLENLIRRYGLSGNVAMTGFIPPDKLADYYGAADFFVLPTRKLEGFGLVTVESLACGTPVLGTPVGGTLEILSGLDSQFLFHNATAESMAEGIQWAIETWLSDDVEYEILRSRCRKYAEKNYSWEMHIQALHSKLLQLDKQNHTCLQFN